jgi:hypothetical protein
VITRIQITNGYIPGNDIVLGLYRNQELVSFYTLPAGTQNTLISGLSVIINTNDYITVNVVSGSGRNLTMVLLSV